MSADKLREANPEAPEVSKEIAVFLGLAKAFSGQTDLFTLLELIKNEATRLTESDRASIFLVDKETNELWTLMADGVNVIRLPYGKGIVGTVISENTILNIPDTASDSRFYKEADQQTGYQTRNILCVPMRNRFGEAMGAIEVLNKNEGPFTEYDESLLMILGTQSAVAIENVEMLEDVKESLDQLNLLTRIQRQANYLVDVNSVLEMILREVVGVLEGEAGVLVRLHDSGSPIATLHLPPDQFETFFEGDADFLEWTQSRPVLANVFEDLPGHMKALGDEDLFTAGNAVVAGLKTKEKVVGYIEVRNPQGEERLFNRRARDFLKVVAGQILSFLENRRLLEDKSRADKMAVVGNMVSVIVHDIKNPLSGISGYAQLIQRRSKDDTVKGFVDVMLEELTRLEQMNNELLTFVRGDQISLEFQKVDIHEFLDEIVRIVGPDFENNRIELTVEQGHNGEVELDRDRMKRVFVNIANNARDAMPEGGKFWIVTRSADNGKSVTIELRDNGMGMRPEIKARLFEPFFTSGKKNGTGLGMAITQSIVEKHGGSISIESEEGKGTSFFVNIPT